MNILKGYEDKISGIFSDWIQIKDLENPFTIESFPYSTGVIEIITKPHCANCSSINYCWFKNEESKKPDEFDYTNSNVSEKDKGLYHPHCHCNKIAIKNPKPEDIKLIIPEGKTDWLIKDKIDWINAMGYKNNKEFIEILFQKTKESFASGNYKKVIHNQYGFKINIFLSIPGANEKIGKIYKVKTVYMIFPNGKLKNNTLLGGWA